MKQFAAGSRYANCKVATYQGKGQDVQYVQLARAPLPAPAKVMGTVEVTPNDRPDLLAYRAYGNPLQYWRLTQENDFLNPFDMTAPNQVGRSLKIPLPIPE